MNHKPIRVLLVEDSDIDAEMVRVVLEKTQGVYSITRVGTQREATAEIHEHDYDVVLQDLWLADNEGLEGVRRLKEVKPHLPVVVLSSEESDEVALEAIRSGAQEYLSKSQLVGKLLTRVIGHSIARQKKLIEAEAKALIDPLTGIANRRAFDMELKKRVLEFQRNGRPCSIAMLDIDHFKSVNDRMGHDRGDKVLRQVAQALESALRETDLLARYGGEEFALVLPGSGVNEAWEAIERAREKVAKIDWARVAEGMCVTFSAGVAEFRAGQSEAAVLRRADAALYAAKDTGRDCCLVHEFDSECQFKPSLP